MNHREAYRIALTRIQDALREGTNPWRKPWNGAHEQPQNAVTGRRYQSGNALLLQLIGPSPYWLTYNQARSVGAQVRKGSKGVPIVFYTEEDDVGPDGAPTKRRVAQVYHVFNAANVEGLTLPATTAPAWAPLEACERLVASLRPPPSLTHAGDRAFYRPSTDAVVMPPRDAFRHGEDYYATLFHELTHWTGHPSRLARPTIQDAGVFGSYSYCREELVAEIGSGLLCALTNIDNEVLANTGAYLRGWMKHLEDDRGAFWWAASQAQRAADFLTANWHPGPEPVEVP